MLALLSLSFFLQPLLSSLILSSVLLLVSCLIHALGDFSILLYDSSIYLFVLHFFKGGIIREYLQDLTWAKWSVTVLVFIALRFPFSIDRTAKWLSPFWPTVCLSHVCRRRNALNDRSQLELLTRIVSAAWRTKLRVGNMSGSRSL